MVRMLNLLKANSSTVLSRISIVHGNRAQTSVSICMFVFSFLIPWVSEEKEGKVSGIPKGFHKF